VGTSGCGNGHSEHVDLTYAVVDGGSVIEDAQASVGTSKGVAGAVVGCTDDPGARPD